LAGSSLSRTGSVDGTGTAAHFNYPTGITVDASGNLYVTDTENDTIRKITPAGVVTTLAGKAGVIGYADGTGTAAKFYNPEGITVDASGNLYVTDGNGYSTIRKITSAGVVTILAGNITENGHADGTGTAAFFDAPQEIAVDASGNLYVADWGDDTIRKVTAEGVVTTVAGWANGCGSSDGTGSITTGSPAFFCEPMGIAVDASGNLYVADTGNSTIRKITSEGVVTTLAGEPGSYDSTDGTGSAARFWDPIGIAVDASGNLYVTDKYNDTIRKITPEGVVSTLAGTARQHGSADGAGSAASFYYPQGIAVDATGNLYVADTDNATIRKVTPEGVVTTLAGTAGTYGSTDGTGAAALFEEPEGIAVDASGNLYVADSYGNTIRKITPAGVVTTIIGTAENATASTGLLPASIYAPTGIAVDSTGNLYITVPSAVLTLEP
jgi:sugar lactone lactonase YvrE